MLDIKFIRENPTAAKDGLRKKGITVDIDRLVELDRLHRERLQEIEKARAELNVVSTEIARGDKDKRAAAEDVKNRIKELEPEEERLRKELADLIELLPNFPAKDALEGKDASGNKVVREGGTKRKFSFSPKDYLALAQAHDLIDIERAAKVSGSRFGYLKREAALLEFALVRYAFDHLLHEGFIPIMPPVMIRPEVFKGMGRLTHDQLEERYYLEKDDLYLVGSAEHTLGPLHKDEILEEKSLPIRYLGFSTSFRREAGSYGKDTKGILRVHQFDKVEMFVFTTPEESDKELGRLVSWKERLVSGLGLSYRVVEMCTGDMGWTDARQFDIEMWLPGQNNGKGEYRETHSASNTTDFQARGVNVRYRTGKGKTEFVHMLNATAFAIGRTLIAILENYQQEDGSIVVPEALYPTPFPHKSLDDSFCLPIGLRMPDLVNPCPKWFLIHLATKACSFLPR